MTFRASDDALLPATVQVIGSRVVPGVWKSISHPVTKQVLFSVVENHRWKANQPLTSDKVLMPPPPSAERRH